MAASSLLALIDDIASILDDVAILTKVAAKKTAGVLGDDLALNAQQVSGVHSDRELAVVWSVAKGSFVNKLILVPAALAISALVPGLVLPLLMVGGAYLCYEGFEKLAHKHLHSADEDEERHAELVQALSDPSVDLVAHEKEKIRSAIRTDFVLSAEIIVIALGAAAAAPFVTRVAVLSAIAIIMTVGVYGLVAGIVKLDDAGLALAGRGGDGTGARAARAVGRGILAFAPWLMKTLSIAGMAAMFLVGGGIIVHGIPYLHHALQEFSGGMQGWMQALSALLANGIVGVVTGAVVPAVLAALGRLKNLARTLRA